MHYEEEATHGPYDAKPYFGRPFLATDANSPIFNSLPTKESKEITRPTLPLHWQPSQSCLEAWMSTFAFQGSSICATASPPPFLASINIMLTNSCRLSAACSLLSSQFKQQFSIWSKLPSVMYVVDSHALQTLSNAMCIVF